MFWKRASLRRVLLSALILLGGWGFFSSLYQIGQSWKEYERSRDLADWAHVAGQIMTMAQHLSFERGRTAVVLRADNAISDADRKFIDERRVLADGALAELQSITGSLTEVKQTEYFERWQQVQELRKSVDQNMSLPLTQRAPALLSRWVEQTTAMLDQTGVLAQKLAQHYRQGEEVSRLNQLGFFTLRLRLIAGSEASKISQHVASNVPMTQDDIYALYEMRGQQAIIWAEIERYVDYLADPQLKEMVMRVRQQHQTVLRPLQDGAINSWLKQPGAAVDLKQLTAASLPVLDGISELMTFATAEATRVANARKNSAELELGIHIFFAISILLVLLLAVYYVLAKVVRPLEAVDGELRRIHFSDAEKENLHANEIERLHETTETLTQVFAEKERLEHELRELAFYDALTGLPNRRLMLDRLQQKILRAKREHNLIALLFIDLDKFKPVNDTYGHEMGDWLLHAVGERISACIRASDTAARLGGDEFVVILPEIGQANDALALAEKIREAVEEPFATPDGLWLEISASIGVALYPQHADNERDLLRVGDEAMFHAKNSGRNRVEMLP